MADNPKASERQARTPLPRKDGDKQPMFRSPRMRILVIIVALLAPGKVEPVRIPYSPTFLDQVRANNVDRVSTTGATVDGRFKKDFKYGNAEPNRYFAT